MPGVKAVGVALSLAQAARNARADELEKFVHVFRINTYQINIFVGDDERGFIAADVPNLYCAVV